MGVNKTKALRLKPGQGQMLKTEGEANAMISRPRTRSKFWPRCRFNLKNSTFLVISKTSVCR